MSRSQRAVPLVSTFLLLAAFLGGCSALPGGDRQAAEIADLKQRLLAAQQGATHGVIEVKRLENELAKAKEALRKAEAELDRRRRDDTLRADPATRPAPRRVDQAELEEEILPPPVAPPAAPQSPEATAEEAQALYDRGYTLFHQKSYDLAEASFRSFLTRYPESDLADNAAFWIGESHYAKGDLDAALKAFAETVARYPQGNKVADALLKAGRCLEQLGRLEEASSTFREVETRFPGSAAAAGARERLDLLGANPGKSRPKPG